jgi:diguanylate cyclase (GGDEF)-like protein
VAEVAAGGDSAKVSLTASLRSRRVSYSLIALALAGGAPLGLVLLRICRAGVFSPGWVTREITADAWTYGYVAFSTALVFSAFGYALGRQVDRLVELFSTDPLTNLKNRRVMQERLEEEIAHAERYGTSLSLLLIDLDGLKTLNDRDGHWAGDVALRRAAAAVRSGCRATDIAARWGGDEFALLAPHTGPSEARHLAERIRELAAKEGPQSITVSVGVATAARSRPGWTPEALVREADGALYEAKRLGRNRVVSA